MLEEFTEDVLFDMAYNCQKKYEQKEVETIKKALTGEITSNAQMIEALEDLNRESGRTHQNAFASKSFDR